MPVATRMFVIAALALLLQACGGARKSAPETNLPIESPHAVLVDTILSEPVLGQPLRAPFGLAVDFRGTIYCSDMGNNRIVTFSETLQPRAQKGGYGSLEGQFDRPGFIAVDNGLTVLVTDRGNARLCYFDAGLNYVDEISLVDADDPTKFGEPSGIALTNYGEIWMADISRDRLAVFDNTGTFDRFIAEFGYSGGQVSGPTKLVSGDRDGFYLCDAGNSRISFFDQFGNYVRSIGENVLDYPDAITRDADGRLWVLDSGANKLWCLHPNGTVLYESRMQLPGLQKALSGASDIATLKDGRLIIADTGNNRLVICRLLFAEK